MSRSDTKIRIDVTPSWWETDNCGRRSLSAVQAMVKAVRTFGVIITRKKVWVILSGPGAAAAVELVEGIKLRKIAEDTRF